MADKRERRWRFLEPLKSDRVPTQLIFLDTETLPYAGDAVGGKPSQVFRLGVLIGGELRGGVLTRRHVVRVDDIDAFWQALEELLGERRTTWVFAHNLGFDLTVLRFWAKVANGTFCWRWRTEKGEADGEETEQEYSEKRGYVVISDPPVILSGWYGLRRVMMVDWANYFRTPLSAIGQSLGMPKLAMPATTDSDESWFGYCQRDTEILEASVCRTLRLWKDGKCGPWGPTAASLSHNYFRRRHLQQRTLEVHTNDLALSYERWGFYGGQLVNGWIGEVQDSCGEDGWVSDFPFGGLDFRCGRIYVLDANSLYPSVMHGDLMPAKIGPYLRGSQFADTLLAERDRVGIAYVRVNSPVRDYPVRVETETLRPLLVGGQEPADVQLPKNHRVLYACGRFWTVLSGQELIQALRQGDVDDVRGGFLYWGEPCFRKCVEELWQRKRDAEVSGHEIDRKFWKLILNSLYGKFGQHGDSWVDDANTICQTLWGQWVSSFGGGKGCQHFRSLGGNVQRLVRESESTASCPAIAACVTAGGRARMREYRELIGPRNLYYQDTDSLHVTRDGYDELLEAGFVTPHELGRLKLERVAESAFYLGQKQYRLENDWVLAGVTGKARWIGTNTWQQEEFSRLASLLAGTPPIGVPFGTRNLHMSGVNLSGEKKSQGFVLPFRIDCV